MPTRRIESGSRGRKLTPQEAARYRQLRADIEREQPAIDAAIRAELAEQREWAAVFIELKPVRQVIVSQCLGHIQWKSRLTRPRHDRVCPVEGRWAAANEPDFPGRVLHRRLGRRRKTQPAENRH